MSLRTRVTALAVVGLLAILVAAGITTSRFIQAQAAGHEVAYKLQPAADEANELVVTIAEMERGVEGYVISQSATDLAPYAEGRVRSADSIIALERLLQSNEPGLDPLVDQVSIARRRWLDIAAVPTIAAVRSGNQRKAEILITSDASRQRFMLLESQAAYLQAEIDERRTAEFDSLTGFALELAITLVISTLILFSGMIAAITFINVWVIRPLDHLRSQLREVARSGNREEPIAPSGPPELQMAGQDAEEMRRQLVAEIDEARMAREGLEQESPVVAAIRSELTRPQIASTRNVEIFGDLQPAEGVLAGDWWDVLNLPDGRVAIIVTDVSGHGPKAGIAGLRTKDTLTSVLEAGGSASDAMARGANLFAGTPSRFATAAIVILDPETGSVEWANAGHLLPVIMTADCHQRELGITGPLLSAIGGSWTTQTTTMERTDTLVLWTDGVSESHDETGEQLEDEGLHMLLASTYRQGHCAPQELVVAVLAQARSRAVDWRRDDVTLIAARLVP